MLQLSRVVPNLFSDFRLFLPLPVIRPPSLFQCSICSISFGKGGSGGSSTVLQRQRLELPPEGTTNTVSNIDPLDPRLDLILLSLQLRHPCFKRRDLLLNLLRHHLRYPRHY